MKKMIYQKDRKVEVLHSGEYKGYKFAILNLGLHPTAYIENKVGFREFSDADDYADPHGGFTYCGKAYWDKEDLTPYIGWDYGHYDDYAEYFDDSPAYAQTLKKWTTQEIFDEVKEVIDTLIKNTQQIHERTDIEKIADIIEKSVGTNLGQIQGTKSGFGKSADVTTTVSTSLVAEALVNAGIGDIKQAVREFADKLKTECTFDGHRIALDKKKIDTLVAEMISD